MENPKCPYLAINIPGERPFVMERKLYNAAIKGINIVDTTLTKMPRGDSEIWVLTITHHTGKVRGRLKFYNLAQTRFGNKFWELKRELANWAERYAKQLAASKAAPASKHAKQIARLERELKKLYARQPVNPLLRVGQVYQGQREFAEDWHKQHNDRRKLALIGGWVLKAGTTNTTSAKAYRLLKDAGFSVKKFGSISHNTRNYYAIDCEVDYWKKLYAFTSGLLLKRKAFVDVPLVERLATHRTDLIQFIEDKRQMDSVRNQIESIKLLADAVVPAANETGVVYA